MQKHRLQSKTSPKAQPTFTPALAPPCNGTPPPPSSAKPATWTWLDKTCKTHRETLLNPASSPPPATQERGPHGSAGSLTEDGDTEVDEKDIGRLIFPDFLMFSLCLCVSVRKMMVPHGGTEMLYSIGMVLGNHLGCREMASLPPSTVVSAPFFLLRAFVPPIAGPLCYVQKRINKPPHKRHHG